PLGSVPSLLRPVCESTPFTSGNLFNSARNNETIFTVSFNDVLIGNFASTHNAPSLSVGKNSVPNHFEEKIENAKIANETIKLLRLFAYVYLKAFATIFVMNSTKRLCFSFTFFFNKMETNTGTKVKVKISAPSKAKPSV